MSHLPNGLALIKSGISIYRERAGEIIAVQLIQFLVSFFSLLAGIAIIAAAVATFLGDIGKLHPSYVLAGGGIILLPLLWLAVWVVTAQMHLVRGHGERLSIGAAFGRARKQVWSLLYVMFLSMLITLLASGVPGGLMWAIVSLANPPLPVLIPLLVFGVAGIISILIVLAIRLGFSTWLVVDGAARGWAALKRSSELVTAAGFWPVLGRWAVLMAVFLLAGLVLSALDQLGGLVPLITTAVNLLVIVPVTITTMFSLYRALAPAVPTQVSG